MLQLLVGGIPATRKEIRVMELDYPLYHHAMTPLRKGPDFVELMYDDVPTDEERRL